MRELILTTIPRLIYIDPKTLEFKGEILWEPNTPRPKISLVRIL